MDEQFSPEARGPAQVAPIAHGPDGIAAVGHRDYVGGLWEEIGRLQFDFLVAQGLRPDHVLLDVACGSLRAGVHLIPYLDRGHYLGIDKERVLIEQGLEQEVPAELREAKAPEFVVSDRFEFGRLSRRPDYAMAQSLFTHLPPPAIRLCLRRLRAVATPGCRFFATFFETGERMRNPRAPHDHKLWFYTREEMAAFGARAGWDCRYVGDWGHPRQQAMAEYRPRPGARAALRARLPF
jgi:SAM-dependent methyltransferase